MAETPCDAGEGMNLPARIAGCPVHTEFGALGAHKATALTLDRFDGVYEGHRALLRATVDAAQESPGTRAVAVTLWPPPEWDPAAGAAPRVADDASRSPGAHGGPRASTRSWCSSSISNSHNKSLENS